ncbi:hypothetical protein SDC9_190623 [bioreactor metagenome]|uniref:Uncharacterized protein n=1 Tax=bioreactor metagenome TaxID=1076179 RepID=A0A645I3T2_9ZZZZ
MAQLVKQNVLYFRESQLLCGAFGQDDIMGEQPKGQWTFYPAGLAELYSAVAGNDRLTFL